MSKEIEWLEQAIEILGETGIQENGNYWRASYTEEDRRGIHQLQEWMKEKGFKTYFDEVGNLYGRIQGKSDSVILTGSHRDTVKDGGKYDGALGILVGIEALSNLYKELGTPEKTVEVVATCEEESSRYLSGYIGSRAIIGEIEKDKLLEEDAQGIPLEEAIRQEGYYQGKLPLGRRDIETFIELHIEQGGVLESKNKPVGIVTSIVGLYTGTIRFFGEQNHAGTTPMSLRVDPILKVCSFINEMNHWAYSKNDDVVFTVGNIEMSPGKSNVIPKEIIITFDLRTGKEALLHEGASLMESFVKTNEDEIRGVIEYAGRDIPIAMDFGGISKLEGIARSQGIDYMKLSSGAGHDAQIIGKKIRTNMIFVPSVGGISHSPLEYTHIEDIEVGYRLLKEYIKRIAW